MNSQKQTILLLRESTNMTLHRNVQQQQQERITPLATEKFRLIVLVYGLCWLIVRP